LANRNKVFDDVRGDRNIVKVERTDMCSAGGHDWKSRTIHGCRLQEDVARHERALADAQRLLQEDDDADAAAAGGGNAPAGDDAADPDVTSVSALHAQALGILNVRALIPTVLDLATPSFSKWCQIIVPS
jgi:hypothetical protein